MAKEFDIQVTRCYDDLKALIISTYNGYKAEMNILHYIESKGHKAVRATGQLDRDGIDIIVDDDIKIQVKPSFFFKGDYNEGLLNDRIKLLNQAKKFDKYYVMVYKSLEYDTFDPKAYRPCNLINEDGTTKNKEFNYEVKK